MKWNFHPWPLDLSVRGSPFLCPGGIWVPCRQPATLILLRLLPYLAAHPGPHISVLRLHTPRPGQLPACLPSLPGPASGQGLPEEGVPGASPLPSPLTAPGPPPHPLPPHPPASPLSPSPGPLPLRTHLEDILRGDGGGIRLAHDALVGAGVGRLVPGAAEPQQRALHAARPPGSEQRPPPPLRRPARRHRQWLPGPAAAGEAGKAGKAGKAGGGHPAGAGIPPGGGSHRGRAGPGAPRGSGAPVPVRGHRLKWCHLPLNCPPASKRGSSFLLLAFLCGHNIFLQNLFDQTVCGGVGKLWEEYRKK